MAPCWASCIGTSPRMQRGQWVIARQSDALAVRGHGAATAEQRRRRYPRHLEGRVKNCPPFALFQCGQTACCCRFIPSVMGRPVHYNAHVAVHAQERVCVRASGRSSWCSAAGGCAHLPFQSSRLPEGGQRVRGSDFRAISLVGSMGQRTVRRGIPVPERRETTPSHVPGVLNIRHTNCEN